MKLALGPVTKFELVINHLIARMLDLTPFRRSRGRGERAEQHRKDDDDVSTVAL